MNDKELQKFNKKRVNSVQPKYKGVSRDELRKIFKRKQQEFQSHFPQCPDYTFDGAIRYYMKHLKFDAKGFLI